MNATAQATPVAVESLSVITYNSQPVITTELLANLYGTEPDNIHQNFSSNTDRFTEGKHFIKLKGAELKAFKNCLSNPQSVQISKHARNLTLWTERGAARHAKMLDTDQAWEVFEKLEDCYFKGAEVAQSAALPPPPTTPSLTTRRWLISFDHLKREIVQPIPEDACLLTWQEIPGVIRATGCLIETALLLDIMGACVERLSRRNPSAPKPTGVAV